MTKLLNGILMAGQNGNKKGIGVFPIPLFYG